MISAYDTGFPSHRILTWRTRPPSNVSICAFHMAASLGILAVLVLSQDAPIEAAMRADAMFERAD